MRNSYLHGLSGARRLDDQEIVRLYLGGDDSDAVGFMAGCSSSTVLSLVKRAGYDVRGRGGRPRGTVRNLSDAAIIQGYRTGLSGGELADRAECSKSTVYSVLRQGNIARRRTGGRK
jgi:hypothetical protein